MIDQETRMVIVRLLTDLPSENTPHQWIPLLYKGAIEFLREDADPQSISILEKAVVETPVELARELAFAALIKLTDKKEACDAIYRLAVFNDDLPAQNTINQKNLLTEQDDLRVAFLFLDSQIDLFTAIDPDYRILSRFFHNATSELRMRLLESAKLNHKDNWCEIVLSSEAPEPDDLLKVLNHYSHYDEHEQKLLRNLLQEQAIGGHKAYREALCDISVRYDDQECKNITIQAGYVPQDKVKKAVYLFFTEQWEKYELEDFNHSLLIIAYQNSPSFFRKKMLAHSRRTGYSSWMKGNIGEISRLRSVADLSDADWQITCNHLMENKSYEEMWSLVQFAPPIWSVYFLSQLPDDWRPQNDEDTIFYQDLHNLAILCQKQQLMRPNSSQFSTEMDIRSLTVSSDENILAAGNAQGDIRFWLLATHLPFASIVKSPVPQVRSMAISPDNQYIVCANQDHQIRTFRITDGKLLKTFQGHRGQIRSLIFDRNGHTVYSASFDGTIIAWRFPQGQIKWQHTPEQGEIFGMDLARDGNWIVYGGAGPDLSIIQSNDHKVVRKLDEHNTQITLFTGSQSGNISIAYANSRNLLLVWNLRSGKIIQSISPGQATLTSVIIHPQEHLLIGSTAEGEILIWSISNGLLLHHWQAHQDMIVDLKLVQDGNLLITGAKNGDITLWKLKTLHLALQPVNNYEPSVLSKITDYLAAENLNITEKVWMQYIQKLLQWRQRFDIEISNPVIIEMKEFDIEL